jgi:FKBP-type peptidyl-prolyl cis-trans isomerase
MNNRSIADSGLPGLFTMLITALTLISCGRQSEVPQVDEAELREQMMEANKNLMRTESRMIDSIIDLHELRMNVSGTGLRYRQEQSGAPQNILEGDTVLIAYKIWLSDSTLVSEVSGENPLPVIAGKGYEIKGIDEAILMMHRGERTTLIIPSHLAWGMRGDGKLIPPAATLFAELTVTEIK